MPAYYNCTHPFSLTFKYTLHYYDTLLSIVGKFAITLDPSTLKSECLLSGGAQLFSCTRTLELGGYLPYKKAISANTCMSESVVTASRQ